MTKPHYPNAPITEAIIDIKVSLPDSVGLLALAEVNATQNEGYPNRTERIVTVGQMQLGKQAAASAASHSIGYVFSSEDKKQVFQSRLDGFTMSRLAPYDRWEPFRDEARRLWEIYKSVTNPTSVVRLAVRCINRLDLPLPLEDLKQYLRTVPEVSSDMPQELAGYFMQLRIPQSDTKTTLLMTETIIEPAKPNTVSIVLDIDLFRDTDVPQDECEMWRFLEQLRQKRNEVFEASITDKARELFA